MKNKLILTFAAAITLPLMADDPAKKTRPNRHPTPSFLKLAGQNLPIWAWPWMTSRRKCCVSAKFAEGIGVVVSFVAKGNPAEEAGLKTNDVLTQMDDQLIVNPKQLQALIKGKKPVTP